MTKCRMALLLLTVGLLAAGEPRFAHGTPVEGREPGNARQNVTAGRMRELRTCIEAYRQDHGRYPATLSAGVLEIYPEPPVDFMMDSWGRTFLYYRTASDYFLGSLGRDGQGDGELANTGTEDCDITMINGQFARVPRYVEM